MSLSYGYRNRSKPKARRQYPERQIQKALVLRLELMAHPACLYFAIPNGELGDISELTAEELRLKKKLREIGVTIGAADLCFIFEGKVLFLELKRLKGKPSDDQDEFGAQAKVAGAEYFVCDNIDDAVALLVERGILPLDRRVR